MWEVLSGLEPYERIPGKDKMVSPGGGGWLEGGRGGRGSLYDCACLLKQSVCAVHMLIQPVWCWLP